jgi:hypothetical protein
VESKVNDQSKRLDKAFSLLIQEISEQGYACCRMIETMNNLVQA